MISTETFMCNNMSTLAVYIPSSANPWNEKKINHLYRRAGFGATRAMINTAKNKTPSQVVNSIINSALNTSPLNPPSWVNLHPSEFGESGNLTRAQSEVDLKSKFIRKMVNNGSLSERMTLFWSNILVVSTQGFDAPPQLYKYLNLLERKGLGNFKDLIYDVGISGAMLRYLNGIDNNKNSPNENYARELLELFTLGEGNGYTQNDIVNIARALTGWNVTENNYSDVEFKIQRHDQGEKTFFGETGNWGYDDVIRILFEKRAVQISKFICSKIYAEFVSPNIKDSIVNELAETFRNNNFNVAAVLRQLLKSEHFYDTAAQGVIIKSPIDLEVSLIREMELKYKPGYNLKEKLYQDFQIQAQDFMGQTTVAGWDGDKNWINPSTLVSKWDILTYRFYSAREVDEQVHEKFLTKLLGPGGSDDVEFVTNKILDFFLANDTVDNATFQEALVSFKGNIPNQYFSNGVWNTTDNLDRLQRQVVKILRYIIKLPEFQLK